MNEVTELLSSWSNGDPAALDSLIPHVYRELHAIARRCLSGNRPQHTLQPTSLINEAYLRLVGGSPAIEWQNRAHFFAIAARVMRNIVVDYARARGTAKRGGNAAPITLSEAAAACNGTQPDILEIDRALEDLASFNTRMAKIIELRYFGGMTHDETAVALGVSVPTVKRDSRFAEAWLRRYFSA